MASNMIERAHQMYREGRHHEALGFYTEALAIAKMKVQKIALHSNRAACYLKLHDFKKAAEECSSVLELDHKHTGALMLRAQTLVTLKEYQSALFDVSRLLELNPSSEVYQNLQARLKTQLSLAPIPECLVEEEEEEEEEEDKDGAECIRGEGAQLCGKEAGEQLYGGDDEKEGEEAVQAVMGREQKSELQRTTTSADAATPQTEEIKEFTEQRSKGWQAIPKPKGHSHLDYSRWDRVDDSSEEEEEEDDDDDDDDSQLQYRFRVRKVGVKPVK
ncbi:uncharacterized protein LOC131162031 [Malania oleifera]|uniref:uncharacterized protein LOC131162031 n=1 Tax=Malania oleifera TaxID=397392 RepID=UPI0025AE42D4|nr:uncharacterized protein LOC131162031 [Malania oleifera]XP_057974113.1 uncharacterized protein LOC131162031 [Malania oleifera]XP_057974114.1 uncharacterized protein LOC131162031 [Malania oleifera]